MFIIKPHEDSLAKVSANVIERRGKIKAKTQNNDDKLRCSNISHRVIRKINENEHFLRLRVILAFSFMTILSSSI